MNYADKKIMFITGSLTDGGAERVISILASGCAELGADVSLVVLREKRITYHVSEKVKLYQIATPKHMKMCSRIKQLHTIIKNCQPDVLIPFLPIVSLYTLIANIGIYKKIIMSERADPNISLFDKNLNLKDKIGILLMRKLGMFNFATWMVFQTPDAQQYYNKRLQQKSSIIPNPIEITELPERHIGVRRKQVVAVGRLSEEKNFPLLIDAFERIQQKYKEYTLYIYGEGKLKENLKQYIADKNLSQCVFLPGYDDKIAMKIVDCAMYVSSSNHEGISNSMLEALGMGIPTVVTDCPVGGAKLMIKSGYNGLLVPMNDVDALYGAMDKILSDSVFAETISRNAVNIREELNAENICKEWLAIVKYKL